MGHSSHGFDIQVSPGLLPPVFLPKRQKTPKGNRKSPSSPPPLFRPPPLAMGLKSFLTHLVGADTKKKPPTDRPRPATAGAPPREGSAFLALRPDPPTTSTQCRATAAPRDRRRSLFGAARNAPAPPPDAPPLRSPMGTVSRSSPRAPAAPRLTRRKSLMHVLGRKRSAATLAPIEDMENEDADDAAPPPIPIHRAPAEPQVKAERRRSWWHAKPRDDAADNDDDDDRLLPSAHPVAAPRPNPASARSHSLSRPRSSAEPNTARRRSALASTTPSRRKSHIPTAKTLIPAPTTPSSRRRSALPLPVSPPLLTHSPPSTISSSPSPPPPRRPRPTSLPPRPVPPPPPHRLSALPAPRQGPQQAHRRHRRHRQTLAPLADADSENGGEAGDTGDAADAADAADADDAGDDGVDDDDISDHDFTRSLSPAQRREWARLKRAMVAVERRRERERAERERVGLESGRERGSVKGHGRLRDREKEKEKDAKRGGVKFANVEALEALG